MVNRRTCISNRKDGVGCVDGCRRFHTVHGWIDMKAVLEGSGSHRSSRIWVWSSGFMTGFRLTCSEEPTPPKDCLPPPSHLSLHARSSDQLMLRWRVSSDWLRRNLYGTADRKYYGMSGPSKRSGMINYKRKADVETLCWWWTSVLHPIIRTKGRERFYRTSRRDLQSDVLETDRFRNNH